MPGCWVIPSAAATASGTAAGSLTAPSSISHTPSENLDTDRAATDPQYAKGVKKMLAGYGIEISGLSNHLSSQMVLPFGDSSLDEWAGTSDKEEMVRFGTEHIIKTAQVASEMEIGVVNGFFGSTVWESWYIWPPQRLDIYEKGWDLWQERWDPILDKFKEYGVKFAHEVHPTEIAYNVYTAREAVKRMPRDDWGFNFDPSHFVWQDLDPVGFLWDFKDRIYHVDCKESVKQLNGRNGRLGSHLPWADPRRGWDFVSTGHGDVPWEDVFRMLNAIGYDGPISIEWEDAGMDRLHGAPEAIAYVRSQLFDPPATSFDAAFSSGD